MRNLKFVLITIWIHENGRESYDSYPHIAIIPPHCIVTNSKEFLGSLHSSKFKINFHIPKIIVKKLSHSSSSVRFGGRMWRGWLLVANVWRLCGRVDTFLIIFIYTNTSLAGVDAGKSIPWLCFPSNAFIRVWWCIRIYVEWMKCLLSKKTFKKTFSTFSFLFSYTFFFCEFHICI